MPPRPQLCGRTGSGGFAPSGTDGKRSSKGLTSVRATTQETRLWQGEALQFVRGVPNGRSDVVEVRPGEIPGQIPDRESWNSFVFNIREFAPPQLGAPFDKPLPHINLDKVLQSLIA